MARHRMCSSFEFCIQLSRKKIKIYNIFDDKNIYRVSLQVQILFKCITITSKHKSNTITLDKKRTSD